MPLQDWSVAADNVFRAFHLLLLGDLSRALNDHVLPAGYFARPEEYLGPFQADVLTLESGGALGSSARSRAEAADLVPTATIAPPRFDPLRQRRLTVFSARDERRVAVIEVVSPGNKDSARRARQLTDKLIECLASGLHVLVIDLLPPTAAAPGFGAAVARELGSDAVAPVGRCTTSFECQPEPLAVQVYQRELALGRALDAPPLFLEPGRHVELPLEETYASAFRGLPAHDRARLEAS